MREARELKSSSSVGHGRQVIWAVLFRLNQSAFRPYLKIPRILGFHDG